MIHKIDTKDPPDFLEKPLPVGIFEPLWKTFIGG